MGSRPVSTVVDFQNGATGPDDHAVAEAIRACLAEVDLDTVTKKQGSFSLPRLDQRGGHVDANISRSFSPCAGGAAVTN